MRKKIVAGNWKKNMELAEGLKLAESVDTYFRLKPSKAEVILCTPYIHLAGVSQILKDGNVRLGAQNCASEPSGAYTGEISPAMILSTGAGYVIIGHSERRSYYHEDNQLLNRKTKLALSTGLKVIFCCGEVLGERESGNPAGLVRQVHQPGALALIVVLQCHRPVVAHLGPLGAQPEPHR